MDKDEFNSIGKQLFGYGWMSKLSRLLKLSSARSIRRWAKGETAVPESVALLLKTWLDQREGDVQ